MKIKNPRYCLSSTYSWFSVRANEGDAYPLGALPLNTQIHCLEKNPGHPFHLITAAGTYGTILRKYGDHVVVQIASKKEFAFHQTCMATVGKTLLLSQFQVIHVKLNNSTFV